MAIETITGIHGVPRSGTSWLAQLFNASPQVALKFQPLFSYAFKDALGPNATSKEIDDFFKKIYNSKDDFLNMRDPEIHKDYPEFIKDEAPRHLVFKQVRYHNLLENLLIQNKQLKLILLLRNPLAVLASWYKAPREFNPKWDFNQEWFYANLKNQNRAEEYFGYERWKNASTLFLNLSEQFPDRVRVVQYNQLLTNTKAQITQLFNFAGIAMHQNVLEFIEQSKARTSSDPNSVFKSKTTDDAWKDTIPKAIVEQVQQDLENNPLKFLL